MYHMMILVVSVKIQSKTILYKKSCIVVSSQCYLLILVWNLLARVGGMLVVWRLGGKARFELDLGLK